MKLPSIHFSNDTSPGRFLLILSLVLFSIGLPLSPFMVGFSQFLLLLSWLIEGDFKSKFKKLQENRALHLFLLLPLIHIIWLLNTADYSYALHDIKIKLPLLVFPLILGTTNPLSKKELQFVLGAFVFAVFSGTVVTMSILTGIYEYPYTNIRDASIFISHIRFGLMLVFSLVLVGHFIAESVSSGNKKYTVAFAILLLWFLVFLIILQSITSWVILFLLLFFIFLFYYKQLPNKLLKMAGWLVLTFMVLAASGLIAILIHNFYFKQTIQFSELPKQTPRGNLYLNDTISKTKENGHYVNILISYKELNQTWPKISQIPFNGKDANGYPIWATMIRYLASKGLPKDQDGLMALDEKDIAMIENGYASSVYRSNFIPYIRSYSLLWELDRYFKSGDANNKSVAQRLEYLKAAKHIIKNNFWLGIGTGDLNHAYDQAFIDIKSKLAKNNQFRAHNQYLTFLVAFGIFGFLLALLSIIGPILKMGARNNYMLVSLLFIILLSLLNEDTFETQAGVSFYIFFYTVLLFSSKK